MKRWYLAIILFLSFIFVNVNVNAAGLSLETNVVDNLIMVGEEAVFDITILNDQAYSDKVSFIVSDLDWVWEKETFDIRSGGSKTFTLSLRAPSGVVEAGVYTLNLKVYSTQNPEVYVYEPLLITVLDESSMLRVEKIDYTVNGLNPKKDENILKVIVKNRYDKPVNDVNVILQSNIFSQVSKETSFSAAELKTLEFPVTLNSNAAEGFHDVNILIKRGDQILLQETKKVKVGEYSDVKEDKEVSTSFLISKVNVVKRNEGTTTSEQVYRVRLSSFERLFSDVSPEPSLIEKSGSDYYYIWTFTIQPGESYEINIEINYRDPLALLIALIIIVYLIYYLTESGISITKRVLTIKSKEGITYMKVLLLIKNRGKHEIKNIRVADQILNAKTVPSDYGTLRPSKINRSGDYVTLLWDIPSLIGKEERILSYRVNVEVKNKIVLPRAMARYRDKNKTKLSKSNSSLVVA